MVACVVRSMADGASSIMQMAAAYGSGQHEQLTAVLNEASAPPPPL